jgi:hypothetical protein
VERLDRGWLLVEGAIGITVLESQDIVAGLHGRGIDTPRALPGRRTGDAAAGRDG